MHFNKTRFAPSPTGYLHRGHIWSALQVWSAAHIYHCKVHLRIEDHDQSRCRPAYISSIYSDLEWVGFEWDSTSIQSQRAAVYSTALNQLQEQATLYYCDCSRQEIRGSTPANNEPVYSGRCRLRNLKTATNHALRLQLPTSSSIDWVDLRLGAFTQDPAQQCGDPILIDKQQQWTYQFAVAVDDWDEEIDLVVRGEDLLESTARQILIGKLLGRKQPPAWLHHSLLYGPNGSKLSKRDHATSIESERFNGITAEQLIGEVCHAAGLIQSPISMDLSEALERIQATWLRPTNRACNQTSE
jgi:glutamyl/glutaminyl-tRNA synthetase